MIDTMEKLKAGRLDGLALGDIGAEFRDAHRQHVADLQQAGVYDVFGTRFDTLAGIYQPHPTSSSVFLLRTLLRERPALGQGLELGCGSGVVGLSLLRHGLAHQMVMTDVDVHAVRAAGRNADALNLATRSRFCHGNLFEPVAGETFDSIVFNLPLLHRPHEGSRHIALDDPQASVTGAFFEQATRFLKPGGKGYFSYSNISEPALLDGFSNRAKVSLLAAEWVASKGFWLLVYEFSHAANGAEASVQP